jgi:hypothetical protein
MINATEIDQAYEDKPGLKLMADLKRRVSDSPLLALGVAVGAGALAYGLLRPRPKQFRGVAGAVANAVGGRGTTGRAFKAAIGSLALSYLNRRFRSKMPWR